MTESLRETMDALTPADGLDSGPELYEELAPVYDFVSARLHDYDVVAAFVKRHAPPGATAIAVGACGTGHLLARLTDSYAEVLGFDRSRAMLDLCAARTGTDAHLVVADLRTCIAPGAFDVVAVLGGSIAHLPADGSDGTDGVVTTFESAYGSLAPGGVFLCDFMESGALESGRVVRDSWESERFRVDRTVLTTADDRGSDELGAAARYTYAYELTDRRSGETVRTGTSEPVREFRTGALLGVALAAGFDDVTLVTPPTHGAAVVATRRA